MRTLYCDFCHAVLDLSGHAWHCPARDFDYPERRIGLDADAQPMDGSIGAWIACDQCAAYVRNGHRQHLLARALHGNYGATFIATEQIEDLAGFLDLFWMHRDGPPVQIGSDQLALIASDPATVKEPRE